LPTDSEFTLTIESGGDVVMRGRDADDFFGDPGYEYVVRIPGIERERLARLLVAELPPDERRRMNGLRLERVIQMCVERLVSDRADASSAFMGWLKKRGVPYEFAS
jgi:hypothetical protein